MRYILFIALLFAVQEAGAQVFRIPATADADSVHSRGGGTFTIPIGIASGGTGAGTAGTARQSLGLEIGVDVQGFDQALTDVSGLTPADGNVIVGDGANWVAESGATFRASVGLTIGTDIPSLTGDTYSGVHNFGGGILELPNSTAPTSTECDESIEAGRIHVDTDATTGQQLYVCEGTAGWVLQSGGGGASGDIEATSIINTGKTTLQDSLLVSAPILTDSNLVVGGQVYSPPQELSGTTPTWDVDLGQNAYITLTGNTTITLSNLQDGSTIEIEVTQDGTGGRTLSIDPGSGAIVQSIFSEANAVTRLSCKEFDVTLRCFSSQDATEFVIPYFLSNQTSDLTTGLALTVRAPFAYTINDVRLAAADSSTGLSIIANALEEGTTIFSTKPSIDASEKTSETAATPFVLSDPSIADDAEVSFVIDQVGSLNPGKGLMITFYVTRD